MCNLSFIKIKVQQLIGSMRSFVLCLKCLNLKIMSLTIQVALLGLLLGVDVGLKISVRVMVRKNINDY